ncbi:alpha/beta hydrolase [Flavobacteriaceae bacterium TP-CH-4]|uniref:Proline iminopeptidase n=1 Tax=Pelagihabitans pacificus TaxID=2696054 RepID=A0A967AU04_9FLAO|nr:alpha/beta fold hydrolase [Pelagihabitans pacificus]NHF60366.1 alpha/beta hydrolase [Pelagihabitans pacificus]
MRSWTVLILAVLLHACNTTPPNEVMDGILEVPENRLNRDSRTLKLAYKVLKAKKADSLKAPILFLAGGPGAPTLFMEEYWKNHLLRNDRDIVLMDQRGTGASEAICIDMGKAIFAIVRQDLGPKEELLALDSIFNLCKKVVNQKGVDMAGYTSQENAADFEDLRKELGYEQWNLFGASYGSRLGLTIMRDFPNSVRSSIFVGVFAPESQLSGETIIDFEKSLFEVLRRCEQNEKCNSRYPHLKNRLLTLLKKLRSEPLHLNYDSQPFVLNRRDALLLLHHSLYSRYTIAYIPKIIEAMEKNELEPISNALQRLEFIYNLVNWPMNNSIMAYEELPFIDSLKINNARSKSELGFDIMTFEGFNSLSDWHPFRAEVLENQPVISEIPTLMASGSLDPVTPISNANEALRYLKNGHGVIFPDESHDLANPCFLEIAEDFLNNPFHKPDVDCSSRKQPLEWDLHNPSQ